VKTTARLLAHLELIRHEITAMDNEISDAPCGVCDVDRRLVRQKIAIIAQPVDELLAWLSESPLESPVS